jgi:hypothetical protein
MNAGSTVNTGSSGLTAGAQGAGDSGGGAAIAGGGTDASFIAIESGRPEFQAHLLEVASKNPELMKLLREHADAVKRYQEIFQKLNGPGTAVGKTDGADAQAK